VTHISRPVLLLLLLFSAAIPVLGQSNFSVCDINRDGAVNILDAQAMANQALGQSIPANDLTVDGVVNVLDVRTEIDAILYGCPFYSATPRFAITTVSLVNQAWIPSDIPSPGNLAITSAAVRGVSVVNQAWISADVPSAGNLTVNAADAPPVSVVNQAWISADIPGAGNLTVNAANAVPVSLVNQAWISADIPSPGDVRFAAGLLVSINNNATPGPTVTAAGVKILGGGSSTALIDLASVHDGDGLIAGQTIRFRVYPPEESFAGSDFLLNGTPLRIHAPFDVLLTAPANVAAVDLQAVIYAGDGRLWRTPGKHLSIVADPGRTLSGHALRSDGGIAMSAAIGVLANGLSAEYFRADTGLSSWSDLNRPADKRGYVTAVNQPDSSAFGADPFGTGFSGSYATRFRGQILVSTGGPHQFFLDAPLGARLTVDGSALIDTPAGVFSPESQAEIELAVGWHTIEIESYQTASRASLQLSWRQPNSGREIVRPEALAAELGSLAVTDSNGAFHLPTFPTILNPLEWHPVPADSHIRVVLAQSISEERPIQQ
jgi:hypothetical protein